MHLPVVLKLIVSLIPARLTSDVREAVEWAEERLDEEQMDWETGVREIRLLFRSSGHVI